MVNIDNFKKLSFLVYGLGSTGKSVINFSKKIISKIIKYGTIQITSHKKKKSKKIKRSLKNVNYIVLSPELV